MEGEEAARAIVQRHGDRDQRRLAGASTPLAGLKATAPGTVVEVDQRSDPLLLDRASTLAAQL